MLSNGTLGKIGGLRPLDMALRKDGWSTDGIEIVLAAVNGHDTLVTAIETAVECDLNFDGTYKAHEILATVEAVRAQLRAALAKAEGRS